MRLKKREKRELQVLIREKFDYYKTSDIERFMLIELSEKLKLSKYFILEMETDMKIK